MSKYFSIEEIQERNCSSIYKALCEGTSYDSSTPGFYGPSSVGKWALAERFARHILCLNGTACDICPSCKSFE